MSLRSSITGVCEKEAKKSLACFTWSSSANEVALKRANIQHLGQREPRREMAQLFMSSLLNLSIPFPMRVVRDESDNMSGDIVWRMASTSVGYFRSFVRKKDWWSFYCQVCVIVRCQLD
jgi:hypothetical protein